MIEGDAKKRIRNWTLYVIRMKGNSYYIGITSRADFMKRIRQHGGRTGAYVNRGRIVEEIIEIQHLGFMSAFEAENIENDVTIEYIKRYGRLKVRGGRNIQKRPSLFLIYNPGSIEAQIQTYLALLFAIIVLIYLLQA